jgi:hypothetical protein
LGLRFEKRRREREREREREFVCNIIELLQL